MTVDSPQDLEGMMRIGQVIGKCIQHMAAQMQPGMTTAELDKIGQAFLESHGARSAPILTYNFPGWTCISINDEAAHGIPGERIIQPGDLVNIDVSAELGGYIADSGASFPVPPVSEDVQRLCDFAQEALAEAIDAATAGAPLRAIGKASGAVAKRGGYRIIRSLGGHGVGRKLHEPPHSIPHYDSSLARGKLKAGMVFTIEPFLSTGVGKVETDPDGWTLRTVDGELSAQYEHTVIITEDKPVLVTAV